MDIINELGAMPVVLPDVPGAKGEDYVDLFDALIIPGGPDADPTFYGEEPSRHIGSTNYKFTKRASRFSVSAAAASLSIF